MRISKKDVDIEKIFNSAVNFALDKSDGDGLIFLRMWREGDWNGIQHEFPDYEIPVELINPALAERITTLIPE